MKNMPTKKEIPAWIKTRKSAINNQANKLFLFPEGKTEMVIAMNEPPQERDFGTEEQPQIRQVYTAAIDGQKVEFAPSKKLEAQILSLLEQGNNHMVVLRTGLKINNTKYLVKSVSE